eukprot:TRINITY_DN7274_c0_g1_i1.p1 TRINITY_DN7274_c0_g1~~TRINITY_DN7274_c0_g1_i1.p1  ORF type:complete len:242 (+),score=32.87 TRINITY_DN7274_c0_g1_i1:63-728(+)
MSVLVTGGVGELGQTVVAEALRQGLEVHATYFNTVPPKDERRVHWHQVDICDRDSVLVLCTLVPRGTNVIHCAVSPQKHGFGDLRSATVDSAVNVADAASLLHARCVVLSTDLVFNGKDGSYTELSRVSPILPYGEAKVEMEKCLLQRQGDVVIVRTSLILTLEPAGKHIRFLQDVVDGIQSTPLFTDEIRNAVWADELARAVRKHGKFHLVVVGAIFSRM